MDVGPIPRLLAAAHHNPKTCYSYAGKHCHRAGFGDCAGCRGSNFRNRRQADCIKVRLCSAAGNVGENDTQFITQIGVCSQGREGDAVVRKSARRGRNRPAGSKQYIPTGLQVKTAEVSACVTILLPCYSTTTSTQYYYT